MLDSNNTDVIKEKAESILKAPSSSGKTIKDSLLDGTISKDDLSFLIYRGAFTPTPAIKATDLIREFTQSLKASASDEQWKNILHIVLTYYNDTCDKDTFLRSNTEQLPRFLILVDLESTKDSEERQKRLEDNLALFPVLKEKKFSEDTFNENFLKIIFFTNSNLTFDPATFSNLQKRWEKTPQKKSEFNQTSSAMFHANKENKNNAAIIEEINGIIGKIRNCLHNDDVDQKWLAIFNNMLAKPEHTNTKQDAKTAAIQDLAIFLHDSKINHTFDSTNLNKKLTDLCQACRSKSLARRSTLASSIEAAFPQITSSAKNKPR